MAVDIIIDPLTGQIYWNDSQTTAQSIAISGNGTDLIKVVGYSLGYTAAPSGTITTGAATTAVTGSGTAFTTQLAQGAILYTAQGTSIGTVSTITNDTSLSLTTNASGSYTAISFRITPSTGTDRLVFSDSATPIYPATTGANLGTSSYRWSVYASAGDFTNTSTTTPNILIDKSGIGSTESAGLQFVNTSLATSGGQYQFPSWLEFKGKVWNTTVTAASNDARLRIGMAVNPGTSPQTEFVLASSIDTGTASWYYPLTINSTVNDSVAYFNNSLVSIGKLLTLGTTSSYALELYNYSLATSGETVHYSPGFDQNASAWNTSTATSNIVRFRSEVQPTSGASVAGTLVWKSAVATSYSATPTFTDRFKIASDGTVTIPGSLTLGSASGALYAASGAVSVGTLSIANGGTGSTTATSAINALLPTQTGNGGKYLTTDGTSASWGTVAASPGGSSGQIQFNNSSSFGGAAALVYSSATTTAHLTITSQAVGNTPLLLKGIASQSANFFDVQNSSGTSLISIVSAGSGVGAKFQIQGTSSNQDDLLSISNQGSMTIAGGYAGQRGLRTGFRTNGNNTADRYFWSIGRGYDGFGYFGFGCDESTGVGFNVNSATEGFPLSAKYIEDATTNTVKDVLNIERSTSGTAAAGIGARISYRQEHAGGTVVNTIGLDGILSDAGSTTYVGALSVKTNDAGTTTLTERARFDNNAFSLYPLGTSAGNTYELRFMELAAQGSNYIAFKGPDSVATNYTYVWPSGAPSAGQLLSASAPSGGVVTLSWATDQLGTSGGGITSLNGLSAASQSFANDTNVTITSATSTHTLGWTGTLAVGRGGTGTSTAPTQYGVTYGLSTTALAYTAAGSTDQVLKSGGGSAAPSFGSINLASSNAVGTSVLAVGNGGTGQTTYTDGQLLIGNSTGNTLTKATLTAGTNISITNGNGSITINATSGGSGTVSSGTANQLAYYSGATTTASAPAMVYSAATTTTHLTITAQAVGNNPLKLVGTTSQTADLFTVATSGGTVFNISSTGIINSGTWNGTTIAIANGGTGSTTATTAINALLPTQTGNGGKYLTTDGTSASWGTVGGSGTVSSGSTGQIAYYSGATTTASAASMAYSAATTTTHLTITAQAVGNNPLKLVGATSQTADLFTVATSGGTVFNIGSSGLINSGTWNGTTIAVGYGGTGTSATPNQWGIVFATSTAAYNSTAAGTNNQWLRAVTSGAPTWSSASLATTYAAGDLLYASASNTVSGLASTATSVLITQGAAAPSWLQGATGNRFLKTSGSVISWGQVDLASVDVTGTLAVSSGGTGTSSFTTNTILTSGATTTGAITTATALGYSASNQHLTITAQGAATSPLRLVGATSQTADLFQIYSTSAGTVLGSVGAFGGATFTSLATSATTPATALVVTGAAHTALNTATEYSDVYFNLGQTKTFATGAITTLRTFRVAPATYAFSGASTVTNAATFQIDGAPTAGTNATLTEAAALRILTGTASGKGLVIRGATSQTGNYIDVQNNSGTSLVTLGTTNINLGPHGTAAGNTFELRFSELAATGSEYIAFKAPDSITTSYTYVWPNGAPSNGQLLSASAPSTTGVVTLSWATDQLGTSGGGITSLNGLSAASQSFANDTNITITSVTSTHTLGWTGNLAISRGGIGTTSLTTSNAIVYYDSTNSKLATLGTGATTTVLVGGGASAPSFAQVDLTTMVTGTLPLTRGGLGTTTFTQNGVIYGNAATSVLVTAAGTSGQLFLGVTSGAPQWGTMSGDASIGNTGVITIANSAVTYAKIQSSVSGNTVLGRSASSSGVFAEIAASSDGSILRLSATTLGFGSINLASSNAVGSSILPLGNGGLGTTTFTQNGVIYGNAGTSILVTAAGTNGQLFLGVTSGAPQWGTMSGDASIGNTGVITIANSAVTYAKIQSSVSGNTVLGRSAATGGAFAEIAASSDGSILRLNGTALGFGSINLASSNTVGSSILPIANGGTGSTTAANAINALLPTQTGNGGKYLTTDGTSASWGTVGGSGTVGSGTANQLAYYSGATTTASAAAMVYSTATTTSHLTITAQAVGNNPLKLVGTTSQTADLFTVATSGGTVFNISSTGIINSGTWNGTTIAVGYGGTGTSTAPTQWGVIFATSTSQYASTGAGSTDAPLLARTGAAPAFAALPLGSSNAVTGILGLTNGGTATSSFATTNGLIYYTGSALATLATTASGVLVTNGSGVPSVSTDIPTAVTIGGAYNYRAGGTDVALADGGTGQSTYTNGDILYYNSTSSTTALTKLGIAATSGYFLTSTGSAPQWSQTLGLTNGGTGLTSGGTANYILGMNSGASALEYKQLVQGSNITITHGAGTITIAASGGTSSALPGGSDTYVQYNNGGTAFGGTSYFAYNYTSALLTLTASTSIQTTSTAALELANNSAASTSVANHYSPALDFAGKYWSAGNTYYAKFRQEVQTTAATPTHALVWKSSGTTSTTPAFTNRMALDATKGLGFYAYTGSSIGTSASFFKAGSQTSDFNYTLPITAPSTSQVLSVSAVSGSDITLAWATSGSGSGTVSSGTASQLAYYSGTTTTASAPALVYSATGTHLTITAQGASTSPLKVVGAASQSASIFTVSTSGGDVLTVDSSGFTSITGLSDTGVTFQNSTTTSKKFKFDAASITAATTRTITIPDATTTMVGTDATQTLTNKTISGFVVNTSASVSAAGTTQGTATAITADYVVVTSATAGSATGVILPTAVTGREVMVVNRSNTPIKVYPATGASIDGGSANASTEVGVNQFHLFAASSSTSWYMLAPHRPLYLTFCAGYTPATTGADSVVLRIPDSSADGTTVLNYTVRELFARVETPSAGTSTIQVEYYTGTGAFSATNLLSAGLNITGASAYEFTSTSLSTTTLTSGTKLRLNFTALNTTHANFYVQLLLEEA